MEMVAEMEMKLCEVFRIKAAKRMKCPHSLHCCVSTISVIAAQQCTLVVLTHLGVYVT